MRRSLMLLCAAVLLGSSADAAERALVRCGAVHFLRNGNAEIGTSTVSLRNFDLEHDVTIERITYRNFFGDVVSDTGPAIGVPHPRNTDITPAQDITVVPPGASYYLATNHIWGNDPIPGAAGNQQGNNMSVVVEFSKRGKRDLFDVGASLRERRRILVGIPPIAQQGEELSRQGIVCNP